MSQNPRPHEVTATAGQVRLADKVVAVATVKRHPERYSTLFGRARSEVGHGVCLCRTDQVVRLVIRCRAGRYHLAHWPTGDHHHAPGCPWYRSPSTVSGRGAYRDAVTDTEGGTSIRLSVPLIVRGVSADPTDHTATGPDTVGASTRRRALGPLALLHYLWEAARLNVWHPHDGHRTWSTCRARLAEQAQDCRVNQLELATRLWIVPPFQRAHADRINAAWRRYLDRLDRTGRIRHRGLLLGEIRAIDPAPHGVRILLAQQRAPLYASSALIDRARRSYPSAFSDHAARTGRRRIMLCLIERSRRGHPLIIDLAATLTTASYLPVDSSHEADMADALTVAGRAFLKPLHYDGGEVFPDFVLIDDTPPTFVEVWGVRGRERYEARKRVKQAHYRNSGMGLLEWDARSPMPDLSRPPLAP